MEKNKKPQTVDATKSYRGNIDKYFERMSKGTANRMTGTGTGLNKKRRK